MNLFDINGLTSVLLLFAAELRYYEYTMWGLFEIIQFSVGSLFWGLLLAVLFVALLIGLIRGWYKNIVAPLASYLVYFAFFVLLFFQLTLTVGAIKIISITDAVECDIQRMVSSLPSDYVIQLADGDVVVENLIDEYPVLENYISNGNFYGQEVRELPGVMADELRLYMKWFIARRVGWCLLFTIITAVWVIRMMKPAFKSVRNVERRPGSDVRRPASNRKRVSHRK